MNCHNTNDRCLALAGVFQSAMLVQRVARGQPRDQKAVDASLNSVLITDSPATEQVFGSAANLSTGLRALRANLSGGSERDLEATRYAINLMHLARKLIKRGDLMQVLAQGIERAQGQMHFFGGDHAPLIGALAELYKRTASTIPPRIMVQGNPQVLEDPREADLIRALLLAGVRAAVLWTQCGGSRWQLLLGRSKLLRACDGWLA